MNKIELACSILLGSAFGGFIGDYFDHQKPQNPPAVKVVDFKHVGDITSFYPGAYPAKMFKYDLPNKNGYLVVITTPMGDMTTTYIPREVTWEIK